MWTHLTDINTIFKHCHARVISENVINILILREKFLDLSPISEYAVKMTMYVDCTCINVYRKDVHA